MGEARDAYFAWLRGELTTDEVMERVDRWYAEFKERHPMQEHQDPAITPLAGRYAGRTERFLERVFAETPPSTAQVHSSANGLRHWWFCGQCKARSVEESFDKDTAWVGAAQHDAITRHGDAA